MIIISGKTKKRAPCPFFFKNKDQIIMCFFTDILVDKEIYNEKIFSTTSIHDVDDRAFSR